jgi:hypothetical protein
MPSAKTTQYCGLFVSDVCRTGKEVRRPDRIKAEASVIHRTENLAAGLENILRPGKNTSDTTNKVGARHSNFHRLQ